MGTHTKGPWMLDSSYPGCVYCDDATGSIVARVSGAGFEYAPRPLSERQSNARLIAAAPELLDALRGLVDCSPCTNGCAADDLSCATNAARAAIAKAEGATP